ncbi:unnamed protein product [Arctogadus glacialis]
MDLLVKQRCPALRVWLSSTLKKEVTSVKQVGSGSATPGEASHQHYVFHSISTRLCCRREPNLHSMNKNDGAAMRPGAAPRNQQRKSGAMGGVTPRAPQASVRRSVGKRE